MNRKMKAYRVLMNVTQKEMAELIGIGLTSYNLKEQGKKDFNYKEMLCVLKILKKKIPDITVDEIFFNNEVIKMKTD